MTAFGNNNQFGANLSYKQEGGTSKLRNYVESSFVSNNDDEIDRITRYELYWRFYRGDHWKDYNDTLFSVNYVRAFVDKTNQFLVGKDGFSLQVKSFYSDIVSDDIEKYAEELLLYHWKKSKKDVVTYEMLQMGGICGDVWVLQVWNAERKFVEIIVLDSRQCFPVFKDGDYSNLDSFQVRTPLVVNPEEKDKKENSPYVLKVVEYKKDSVTTWYQKTFDYSGERMNEEAVPNPLGFIPIVHIQNKPQSEGYYSISDVRDIYKLNKVYNEMTQELKSIVDYYATPTTIVTGATVKNLQKGLGKVWSGLPPEANVYNLGLDADLGSSLTMLDRIKTSMHEMSDVPENFLGKIQPISNTSAAALQLTYQPIIQQADFKWMMYGQGICEINRNILKILRKYDPSNKRLIALGNDFEEEFEVEPVFSYGFPKDKMNDLAMAQLEVSLNLNSRKNILERMGVNNIPDLLKAIDEDRLQQADVLKEVTERSTYIPPMPDQGTPPEEQQQEEPPLRIETSPEDFKDTNKKGKK